MQPMMTMMIPHFRDGEIECGKLLGSGAYCRVLKVEDIVLLPSATTGSNSNSSRSEGTPLDDDFKRQQLAHRFHQVRSRGGGKKPSRHESAQLAIYGKPTKPPKEIDDPEAEPAPKLALKRVREAGELSSSQLQIAREDLQREMEILLELLVMSPSKSSLDARGVASSNASTFYHPHIIELYGVGFDADGISSDNDAEKPSFLLLGQIRTTLSQRLVRWRDEKGLGIYEAIMSFDNQNRRNQWVERLLVISKVAHAIAHLHNHKILYRDIKPDNVGYDALDVPKLFDFGLAKKVSDDMRFRNSNKNHSQDDPLDDGLFYLTAETGTLRYMATEVGKGLPYGWSADVYSLAILMHEVLSLTVPFGGVAPRQFRQIVWNQGHGLVVDPSWPDPIKDLLPQMWRSDPTERPMIGEVVTILDGMLRGSEENLFPRSMLSRSRRFALFGAS